MKPPIYLYYEIDNYYQNHRTYIKSRNNPQLNGQYQTMDQLNETCAPMITNQDIGYGGKLAADGITILDPNAPAIPCGIIAATLFNDTFALTDAENNNVPLDSTQIAWPTDVNDKFNNYNLSQQWLDMEDPHFIVWMRTAGFSNFRKLWASINQSLPAGNVTFTITNNYPVSGFDGNKGLVLSTVSGFGGKNIFISSVYLITGGVCMAFAFAFFFKSKHARKSD